MSCLLQVCCLYVLLFFSPEIFIEVNPNNISLACKEIEIDLIKKFFSEDAWKIVIQAVDIRKNQEWMCNVCQEELETRSGGYDRCLLWYHFHCADRG